MPSISNVTLIIKDVYNGGRETSFEVRPLPPSNPSSPLPSPHPPIYSHQDLPLTMQIAELKQRICDVIEDHPLPSQQRLIHSGKVRRGGQGRKHRRFPVMS